MYKGDIVFTFKKVSIIKRVDFLFVTLLFIYDPNFLIFYLS